VKERNLKITARLKTAVVAPLGLPLDGILAYAAVVEQLGESAAMQSEGFLSPALSGPTGRHYRLPLKGAGVTPDCWFYACSMGQARGLEAKSSIQRQLNLTQVRELTGDTRQVRKSLGWAKDVSKPLYAFTPEDWTVVWYAVGHPEKIEALLAMINGVGKKRNLGYGAVREWTVEEIDEDYSLFDADGRLMRAVPVDFFRGEQDMEKRCAFKALFGFRPPYWKTENQAVCLVPRDYGLESL
jgi:CRISPR type IV-associated protein Csf3